MEKEPVNPVPINQIAMDNERMWALVAKKLAGEATAEDILELYDLLQRHPEVHYSLEIFDELWQQYQFAKDRPVAAYARLLRKMEQLGIEFPAGKRLPLQQRIHTLQQGYSLVKIVGLAIGMAASILILLWIFAWDLVKTT